MKRLTECERTATAQLIAALAELDDRRLYLGEGYSSLFTYCTQVLHLSQHAAYGRIEAARAARRFPVILALLARGDITLTAVGLLAPHLTSHNHAALLREEHHKSKRDVERMVACLRPQPPVPAMVRRLPSPRPTAMPDVEALAKSPDKGVSPPPMVPLAPSAVARAVVTPLAPHRYKLQLTLEQETHDKLRRVQDLLRHNIPTGDPAAILDRALTLLLADLERTKCAATARFRRVPDVRKRSRHVPATVKRAVWSRDRASAPSSEPTAAARNAASWSSITSNHTRLVARRRWRTSNCAVVRTITMRKNFSSVCCRQW